MLGLVSPSRTALSERKYHSVFLYEMNSYTSVFPNTRAWEESKNEIRQRNRRRLKKDRSMEKK